MPPLQPSLPLLWKRVCGRVIGRVEGMSRVTGRVPESEFNTDEAWKQIFTGLAGFDGAYRQTRFSSRRVRKRVIFKHGDVNVVQGNVAKRRRRYLQDIFTTLVDVQWRWTLLVFSLNFLLSWLLFAVMWYLISLSHGDLDPANNPVLAASLNTSLERQDWTPCVAGLNSFTSCFLFSVETQHTIGYGGRSTSEECPEAIIVMCIQSIVGVMIQAFMVGIVFVKLSRPIKRTHTLLFSRNAVICQRDSLMCLMFRVGDMRKSHIIEAHIRAQLIRRRVTKEGELLPFHQEELAVGGDGEEDRIFFIWPTTIVHKITPGSPLYRLSAAEMLRERFEIVVILEGIVESTGMTTQARSSYLPSEVLWGHRFENLIAFKKETGEYEVDYSLFNHTYEVETPLCSAATLDQLLGVELHRQESEREKFALRRTPSSEILEVSSVTSRMSLDQSVNLLHNRAEGEGQLTIQVDEVKEVGDTEPLVHSPIDRRKETEEQGRRRGQYTPLEQRLVSPGSRHTGPPGHSGVTKTEDFCLALEGLNPLDLPGPESRI